jgi:hypothetical protein
MQTQVEQVDIHDWPIVAHIITNSKNEAQSFFAGSYQF